MKNWKELRNKFRSGLCVVTINDRVVLMSLLADHPMSVKKLLGDDTRATAKAITTASKIDGYSYFGCENCKVFKLEDWIERAPKDQRGKNGHFVTCVFVIVAITQYANNDLMFQILSEMMCNCSLMM